QLDLRVVIVGGEEVTLHRVVIVGVAVPGVEEAGLQVEPVVKFDEPVDFPTGGAAALRQDPAELLLDGGPAPLGIMVPTDDVNRISPVEKSGERVKDRRMAVGRALQLPHALGLRGGQPQRALLGGNLEGY